MTREVTGTIYKFDGQPWAGARLVFSLLTDTATGAGAAWPMWSKTICTGNDGTIPTGTELDTPPTGSWLYRLRIEENAPLDFYLEQGDGSALTIADIVELANQAGSAAGTPAGEFLNRLYTAVAGADDGKMLETADGGLVLVDAPAGTGGIEEPASSGLWARLVDGVGSWLAATTIGAALFAAVDAAAARLAIGAAASAGAGTAGELATIDASGNAVRSGITAGTVSGGGGAIGEGSSAELGGAVGGGATAHNGGAVGFFARISADGSGGAVGRSTETLDGGAVGSVATSYNGGAVGMNAAAGEGGAVGRDSIANDGGAVGFGAWAGAGFSGGWNAQTRTNTGQAIDAVQLGTGTNEEPRTLQVYDNRLLDADGNIPTARMTSNLGSAATASTADFDAAGSAAAGVAAHEATYDHTQFAGTGANTFADDQNLNGNAIYGYRVREVATSVSGTYIINLLAGNLFVLTVTGNVTITFSNAPATGTAASATVILIQDTTGGHSVTFTGAKWDGGAAPDLATAANQQTDLSFIVRNSGADIRGYVAGMNMVAA